MELPIPLSSPSQTLAHKAAESRVAQAKGDTGLLSDDTAVGGFADLLAAPVPESTSALRHLQAILLSGSPLPAAGNSLPVAADLPLAQPKPDGGTSGEAASVTKDIQLNPERRARPPSDVLLTVTTPTGTTGASGIEPDGSLPPARPAGAALGSADPFRSTPDAGGTGLASAKAIGERGPGNTLAVKGGPATPVDSDVLPGPKPETHRGTGNIVDRAATMTPVQGAPAVDRALPAAPPDSRHPIPDMASVRQSGQPTTPAAAQPGILPSVRPAVSPLPAESVNALMAVRAGQALPFDDTPTVALPQAANRDLAAHLSRVQRDVAGSFNAKANDNRTAIAGRAAQEPTALKIPADVQAAKSLLPPPPSPPQAMLAALLPAPVVTAPPPSVPAASPVVTIDTPVLDPAWADAVQDRVLWLASKNVQTASIRLTPAELGPLQVQISVDDRSVNVAFSATHPVTRAALETALPQLKDMLAESGMSLADASVSDQGIDRRHDENNGNVSADSGFDGEKGTEAESAQPPVRLTNKNPDGLIDTYV